MVAIIRTIACLVACLVPACFALPSGAQEASKPLTFSVLNYVTGWQLDSGGYHPAVFMLIENTSGRDLTGTLIRFQARFTDLETAEVTIGRTEVRRDLKPHQQFPLSVAGDAAFELPGQVDMWPRIEGKVMCRVGSVSDEGTETLLISKIDETARSEDAAFEHLNQATSYAPKRLPAAYGTASARKPNPLPEKPLVATAGRLEAGRTGDYTRQKTDGKPFFLSETSLPGLGDNFFKFEQRFGLPKEFDAKHSDWTWARYQDGASGCDVIAGSHDKGGNVDVVIIKTAKTNSLDVMRFVAAARGLSGKLHAQSLSSATRSVVYLPTGRLELVSCVASGYKATCMQAPPDGDNNLILILARAPHDAEQLLATQAAKVELLKSVGFLAGGAAR